jgi:hypothetical protein
MWWFELSGSDLIFKNLRGGDRFWHTILVLDFQNKTTAPGPNPDLGVKNAIPLPQAAHFAFCAVVHFIELISGAFCAALRLITFHDAIGAQSQAGILNTR